MTELTRTQAQLRVLCIERAVILRDWQQLDSRFGTDGCTMTTYERTERASLARRWLTNEELTIAAEANLVILEGR